MKTYGEPKMSLRGKTRERAFARMRSGDPSRDQREHRPEPKDNWISLLETRLREVMFIGPCSWKLQVLGLYYGEEGKKKFRVLVSTKKSEVRHSSLNMSLICFLLQT